MVVEVLPGIPHDSADFHALTLVDRVLGATYSSRLRRNIRQEKGIAYWTASQLWHYPGTGLWVAFSPVQADKTGVALKEFQREFAGLAGEKPITQAELDDAKNNVIRSFPETFETVWQVADQFAGVRAWGLPPTGFQKSLQRFESVTVAEVNALHLTS